MRRAAALAIWVVLAPPNASAADLENGEAVFRQCRACHQVGEGAKNRVGPVLNEVFGRKAASVEGFSYSDAFRAAREAGLEWHAEELDAFLESPRDYVEGTRMSFRGIADGTDRADLIAYLRTFSASPSDIPEADPTAVGIDHDLDAAILALEGDPDYGAYLSSECTTCHQASGADQGIPSIVGWPEAEFVIALHDYKSKTREHQVMNMIAGRLGDEEIAALAAYFATLDD